MNLFKITLIGIILISRFLVSAQDEKDKLICSFKSDNSAGDLEKVKKYVLYPLPVECFANRSKGDTLDASEFNSKFLEIFDDPIRKHIGSSILLPENSNNDSFEIAIGFSKWCSEFEMTIEYAYVYMFRKVKKTWYLAEITCR